eukprot:COSAG01_NODE_51352_length_355_cov_1.167969_1_plen_93_part_10
MMVTRLVCFGWTTSVVWCFHVLPSGRRTVVVQARRVRASAALPPLLILVVTGHGSQQLLLSRSTEPNFLGRAAGARRCTIGRVQSTVLTGMRK